MSHIGFSVKAVIASRSLSRLQTCAVKPSAVFTQTTTFSGWSLNSDSDRRKHTTISRHRGTQSASGILGDTRQRHPLQGASVRGGMRMQRVVVTRSADIRPSRDLQERSLGSSTVCQDSSNLKDRWVQGAKDYTGRSAEGIMRVAEGGAYGQSQAGGNSFAYWFLAVALTGATGFVSIAPQTAAELLFGAAGRPHDYLQETLLRLVGVGFLGAATQNWVLKNAARDGFLDETIFRRANISLSMFAGTNLFLIGSTFISNPIYPTSPLLPSAALALSAINANQLFVSGVNYVKYAPEGYNTLKIFKSFFTDIKSLTDISGLNSGIYAALTAAFILIGLSYIGLPTQTLDLVFGTSAQKGLEDIFLWHLIGTAVSMGVAAIAFTQKEAANQNNFSDPSKRTLMTGLAAASAAHVAVFLPLLNTPQSGPLLFPVGFVWGVSAVASALIAIKPKE